jgi:hypothetical protein
MEPEALSYYFSKCTTSAAKKNHPAMILNGRMIDYNLLIYSLMTAAACSSVSLPRSSLPRTKEMPAAINTNTVET